MKCFCFRRLGCRLDGKILFHRLGCRLMENFSFHGLGCRPIESFVFFFVTIDLIVVLWMCICIYSLP
jgi:hypothetical protein